MQANETWQASSSTANTPIAIKNSVSKKLQKKEFHVFDVTWTAEKWTKKRYARS